MALRESSNEMQSLCIVLESVAVCWSVVLQCVTVFWSVLECVGACDSVSQRGLAHIQQ